MDESTMPNAQLSYAVQSPEAAYHQSVHSNADYASDQALAETPVDSSSPSYGPPQGKLVSWLRLCRPPTLVLGVAPALISLALLWAHNTNLSPIPAICAPLAVALALAGGNMLDEHLELARSAGQSWIREPGGGYYAGNALEHSGIRPLIALRISLILLALSALVGTPVIVAGGIPVIVLGIIGLTSVFLYSATRFAFKRLPIGELILLLTLGPGLVAATTLSQHAYLSLESLLLGFALGFFAAALVEAAHLRDVEVDKSSGRRTLPVILGTRAAHLTYVVCIVAAYALVLAASLIKGDIPGAAAAVLALPATLIALTGTMRALSANVRNVAVVQTLRAYSVFAAWLGLGIVVWHLVELLIPWALSTFGS
ncbi:MAG: prenyltransferase [Ktedonobacterales bacterium]